MDLAIFQGDADIEARLSEAEGLGDAPDVMREQVETTEQQPAPTPETVETTTQETSPDSTKTDTQATADKLTPEKQEQGTDKSSKYAKDAQRRDTSWKELDRRKEEFRATQEQVRLEKEALQRERQQWEAQRVKQSQKDPAQYESAAQSFNQSAEQMDLQAKGLDAKAAELEEAAKYGESELAKQEATKLRNKAIVARGRAEDAKEYADHIRKNPDPSIAQLQQQEEGARRHYLMESAKAFPELAKEGSQFQKDYVAALTGLQKSAPSLANDPAISWYVSQFVSANTAAARVPALEKELGELRAKVKDFETSSAPTNLKEVQHMPTKAASSTLESEERELRDMVEAGSWKR